jgi:hypothetical protein
MARAEERWPTSVSEQEQFNLLAFTSPSRRIKWNHQVLANAENWIIWNPLKDCCNQKTPTLLSVSKDGSLLKTLDLNFICCHGSAHKCLSFLQRPHAKKQHVFTFKMHIVSLPSSPPPSLTADPSPCKGQTRGQRDWKMWPGSIWQMPHFLFSQQKNPGPRIV